MKPNYTTVYNDILNWIEEGSTKTEKLSYFFKTFESEAGYSVKRYGRPVALCSWLQGLPSAVPGFVFANWEILEIAKKWGSLSEKPTEKEEDAILENYWPFIATQYLKLENMAIRGNSKHLK